MAALPTASPGAGPPAPKPLITTPASISGVSPEQLQEVLSTIPLGASGVPVGELEVDKLAKLLAELPGIKDLSGLPGLGGTAGLEAALRRRWKTCSPGSPCSENWSPLKNWQAN